MSDEFDDIFGSSPTVPVQPVRSRIVPDKSRPKPAPVDPGFPTHTGPAIVPAESSIVSPKAAIVSPKPSIVSEKAVIGSETASQLSLIPVETVPEEDDFELVEDDDDSPAELIVDLSSLTGLTKWKATYPKIDIDLLQETFQVGERWALDENWYRGRIMVVHTSDDGGIKFTDEAEDGKNRWAPMIMCFNWPPLSYYFNGKKFQKIDDLTYARRNAEKRKAKGYK